MFAVLVVAIFSTCQTRSHAADVVPAPDPFDPVGPPIVPCFTCNKDCYKCTNGTSSCCYECTYDANYCLSIETCANKCPDGNYALPPDCLCQMISVCMAGYYKDANGQCVECPKLEGCTIKATEDTGLSQKGITNCYVAADSCILTNDKGTYKFTSDCFYSIRTVIPDINIDSEVSIAE